jgi:FdhE protein
MTTTDRRLKDLGRRHPEWAPWLAVIALVLDEVEGPGWDTVVASCGTPQPRKIPLLAKADVQLDERVTGRMFDNLTQAAGRNSAPRMASLQAVSSAKLDVLRLFQAALNRDSDGLNACASAAGVDPAAFHALAVLMPMPFLHAWNRRCASSVSEDWVEGYCPVCGAWPAFAEVRGIERARYFRCGGCGAEWQARCLFCPYCGVTDHEKLATLVSEQNGSSAVIEACNGCLGYLKTFTTLQAKAPGTIILDDLASVELDLAALERGYKRPPGAGCALDVTVAPRAAPGLVRRSH